MSVGKDATRKVPVKGLQGSILEFWKGEKGYSIYFKKLYSVHKASLRILLGHRRDGASEYGTLRDHIARDTYHELGDGQAPPFKMLGGPNQQCSVSKIGRSIVRWR